VKGKIVDNFFTALFAASESVFTFVTLLEDQGAESKYFTGPCKEQNVLLPLHSQFRKKGQKSEGFHPWLKTDHVETKTQQV
jgi:hypothetical protein